MTTEAQNVKFRQQMKKEEASTQTCEGQDAAPRGDTLQAPL
jgi:hypothetical protein